jgi:clan AA aspartic protease (TIGR02281 family)|tara:strand:+ start:358 stop:1329 length:972 start_codon:yes stop_codon:yes gene_type:complete
MKYFLVFIFILFYVNPLISQCDNPKRINYSNAYAMWCGDLDDDGEQTGLGKQELYFEDGTLYIESGEFFQGRLNGNGEKVLPNGKQTGVFSNGVLIRGSIKIDFNDSYQISTGEFVEGLLHGQNGVMIINEKNGTLKSEGEFRRGSLMTGTETESYVSGLEIIKQYENGVMLGLPVRNDKNYYDVNDIQGDSDYSEIKLKKEGNLNEGISYIIKLEIDGISGDWIFDTGAVNFSIGMRMFDRLKNSGVKYRDLNQTIKTFGVGGESQGKLVLIDKIKIGDYYLNNVIAEVSLDNNYSLLGIEFLSKFSNVEWNMKEQVLKLYK